MTTEPGCLPKGYSELDFKKMSPVLAKALMSVKRYLVKNQKEEESEEEKEG